MNHKTEPDTETYAEQFDREFVFTETEPARDGAPDGHTWARPSQNMVTLAAARDYLKARCEAAENLIEAMRFHPQTSYVIEAIKKWEASK